MGNKNTVYLTQEGLDDLKKELDELINIRRPENVQAIKVTAQTYNKSYTNQGVDYQNVDANSVLRIKSRSSTDIDLKPVDGQPV